ncbi:hypothetical protein C4J81_02850 [Deltaproteobacteria bacterium Smac51]|nr:hypothetical protein C4J81_02850 [Deltaproteobacteria bacterium Smac51]
MITSFIKGRIRLREADFTDPEMADSVAQAVKSFPGVTGVQVNTRTGSLLITYDSEQVDMETAIEAIAAVSPDSAAQLTAMLKEEEEAAPPADLGAESDLLDILPISAPDIQPKRGRRGLGGLRPEAIEYAGMAAAFVVCTSSAFLRSKGLHVYSGLTLAGMTVQHIYKYRKRLLAMFR